MPKNMTLSISDDLAKEMESLPEVNWSSVARTYIMQYIELRKKPDITPIMEKLQKQKGEEYVNGRKKADVIAEDLGYAKLNVLMRKYHRKVDEVEEQEIMGPTLAPWESLPSPEDILRNLLTEFKFINDECTDAFMTGLKDRLKEIEKLLRH